MGWTHIPDMDIRASSADDNPIAQSKAQPTGKVSVKVVRAVFRPSEDWIWYYFSSYGIELIPLFPYLRAGLLKRREGNIGIVPSNLPADQAVVIQQLSIG